ncbi:MAG TPA: hypothetical protein QGF58_07520 [Myxococcota bacterium]|nr:hypothetical protein [Myxococcota bacterium]
MFAAVVGSYAALALAGFVWDDIPLVVNNTLTGEPSNLPLFFQVDLWETAGGVESASGYYRPLVLVSLALDRVLWGLSALGHHLHSLAWHVGASAVLLLLLRRLASPVGALWGTALFALHPVQSEAVAWIAARNDSMAALFVFAGVLALLDERAHRWRLALGGLAVLAGMLSKESAVLAPVLLVLLDLARHGRVVGWRRHAVALGAVVVWFALRTAASIEPASVPDGAQLSWLVGNLHEVLAHYGLRLAWPWPLSVGQTAEYLSLSGLEVAGGLGVLCVFGVAAGVRGGRISIAGLGLAVAAFVPALLAISVRGQLGERYLYLPMAGLALALAAAMPPSRRSLVALLPLCLASVLVLHHRLPEWSSDITLWGAAVEDHPGPYTWTSLGHALNEADRPAEAGPLFVASLEGDAPYPDACVPSIGTPLKVGDLELAARAAHLAAEACPDTAQLAGLRGMALLQVGDFAGASRAIDAHRGELDLRLPLVEAALALDSGDDERLAALAASVPEPARFLADARRLLEIGVVARDRLSQ